MKRFIMTVLGVAVFFVGLGALVDKAGAHFKSDEKALDLVAKARQAIGGDAAIANVQSLRIVGNTTKTLKLKGGDKTEQGETEIAPSAFFRKTCFTAPFPAPLPSPTATMVMFFPSPPSVVMLNVLDIT